MKNWKSGKSWKKRTMGVLAMAAMAGGALLGAGPATLPALLPGAATQDCCDPDVMGAADAPPATQPATQPGLTMRGTGTMMIAGGSLMGTGGVVLFLDATHAEATTIDGTQVVYSTPAVAATEPGGAALPEVKLPPVTVAVSGALEALHDVEATLKSFSAAATKVDTDVRNGDAETNVGTIYYQSNAGGASLAFQVDSLSVTDMRTVKKDQIYIFVPPYFIQKDNLGKKFERDTVVKPGSTVDPLKIGSGLLPLPIGQDPATIVREFDVTEMPLKDAKALPAGTEAKDVIVLKLLPRKTGVYNFKDVTLTVDKKLNLPVEIDETKVDGNTTSFKFEKIEENKLTAAEAGKVFDTAPPAAGWTITLDGKVTGK